VCFEPIGGGNRGLTCHAGHHTGSCCIKGAWCHMHPHGLPCPGAQVVFAHTPSQAR
jgi:hypothetical protein